MSRNKNRPAGSWRLKTIGWDVILRDKPVNQKSQTLLRNSQLPLPLLLL
jgi:hypothetical protein